MLSLDWGGCRRRPSLWCPPPQLWNFFRERFELVIVSNSFKGRITQASFLASRLILCVFTFSFVFVMIYDIAHIGFPNESLDKTALKSQVGLKIIFIKMMGAWEGVILECPHIWTYISTVLDCITLHKNKGFWVSLYIGLMLSVIRKIKRWTGNFKYYF